MSCILRDASRPFYLLREPIYFVYILEVYSRLSSRALLPLARARAARALQVLLLGESSVTEAVVARFQVVVSVDQPESEMLRLNAAARVHGARFVAAETRGLFCRVFSDFGPSFRVDDVNGENPMTAAIAEISAAAPGVVTVQEERRHEMEDGDLVTFSEVRGMTALNGAAPVPIKVIGPFSFTIGDTSGACVRARKRAGERGSRVGGSRRASALSNWRCLLAARVCEGSRACARARGWLLRRGENCPPLSCARQPSSLRLRTLVSRVRSAPGAHAANGLGGAGQERARCALQAARGMSWQCRRALGAEL